MFFSFYMGLHLWIRCWWARRFDLSANFFPQRAQPNGFSPVCDLMCPCRSQGREKPLPHTSHLWLRLWVRMCMERAFELVYFFSQVGHALAVLLVSSIWSFLWRARFDLEENCFPHFLQLSSELLLCEQIILNEVI